MTGEEMPPRRKKSGYALEMKTIRGASGHYLFFRTKGGAYHTFVEVAAKDPETFMERIMT